MNIKDIIKDNTVKFSFFRAGVMFYTVTYNGELYQFPVPVDDVGDATFSAEDKAILFMRYIRKAIDNNEFVK